MCDKKALESAAGSKALAFVFTTYNDGSCVDYLSGSVSGGACFAVLIL